jgi:hypothetical protein
MDRSQINSKISQWAANHLKPFRNNGVFLPPDKRKDALVELFSLLKDGGATAEDVKGSIGKISYMCVPNKNVPDKNKHFGWACHAIEDVISAYSDYFGDPEIEVKSFVPKVFPRHQPDPNIKKQFIDEASKVDVTPDAPSQKTKESPKSEDQDTIEDEMFKPEYDPIDLSIFKKGEKIKITRFDPEMDELLGLKKPDGEDV